MFFWFSLSTKNSVINKDTIIQALGKKFFDKFQKREILKIGVSFYNFEKNCYIASEIFT